MKNRLQKENKYCTGCAACLNKCRHNAITLKEDMLYDFSFEAVIDNLKCIKCGICEDVCPVLNDFHTDNRIEPLCYAAYANNAIRNSSSSGGAFTLLASKVLNNSGYVCGATFCDDFHIKHILISKVEELSKLQRSKYVQSEIGDIFTDILNHLEDEKEVMFVGTPCQVAGLKAFLGREYNNLLLVDLICNYTPPKFILKKYLDENFGLSNIKQVDFRIKKNGWVCDIHQVKLKDNKIHIKRTNNDMFQRGYHPRLFMRKTCEQCMFSGYPRIGDITIGDFWNIGEYKRELDDKQGTSVLLANNDKGDLALENIKDEFIKFEQVALEHLKYNRPEKVDAHYCRDRFYKLVKKYPFNRAVDYALNNKYDIGVLGIWSEKNYGSELTYYALYRILTTMGFEVQMIERPQNVIWKPNKTPILFKNNPYQENALCELYSTKEEMYDLNNRFDMILIGSDQMWHRELYECFGKICYLDFVKNNKKKISYATSFGKNEWTGNNYDRFEASYYLKQFDFISVREKSGVDICKEMFGISANCVLDPVFLCDKKIFEDLAIKSDMMFPDTYIGVYILDTSEIKQKIILYIKNKLKMEVNIISDAFKNEVSREWDIDIRENAYVEDWVKNIITGKFIITDSFHGMCLAIIFKKQFIVINNEQRGGARFNDLLSLLNLQDRLITDIDNVDTLIEKQIDYKKVDIILNKEIDRSYNWLLSALYAEKVTMVSDNFILDKINESIYDNAINIKNINEIIIRHEEALKRQDGSLHWQGEAAFRHEEVLNRNEVAIKRFDDTLYWHEEAIYRHEDIVNRHEEAAKRFDDTLYWQGEALFRHERDINKYSVLICNYDRALKSNEEKFNELYQEINILKNKSKKITIKSNIKKVISKVMRFLH